MVPNRDPEWFDVLLCANDRFSGEIERSWFTEDLLILGRGLAALAVTAEEPRSFVAGGDRAAEVRFTASTAVPDGGQIAVEVWLTASGDDPFPALALLLFDDRAKFSGAAERLDRLMSDS